MILVIALLIAYDNNESWVFCDLFQVSLHRETFPKLLCCLGWLHCTHLGGSWLSVPGSLGITSLSLFPLKASISSWRSWLFTRKINIPLNCDKKHYQTIKSSVITSIILIKWWTILTSKGLLHTLLSWKQTGWPRPESSGEGSEIQLVTSHQWCSLGVSVGIHPL